MNCHWFQTSLEVLSSEKIGNNRLKWFCYLGTASPMPADIIIHEISSIQKAYSFTTPSIRFSVIGGMKQALSTCSPSTSVPTSPFYVLIRNEIHTWND